MPPLVVQKYGGSSLATPEAIRAVASRIVDTCRGGRRPVVVVSAMGGTTDELLDLAAAVNPRPTLAVLDRLLTTGEMAAAALVCLGVQRLGQPAVCLSGGEAGIVTNAAHSNARILEVRPGRVRRHLEEGRVVVVAGFQGVSGDGAVTTLGRGGSDTSAAALAAALGADGCEIFTDVEAVYTADPRVIREARALPELAAAEMQELSWNGARVLKAEAVAFARSNGVTLRVASAAGDGDGTWVLPHGPGEEAYRPRRRAVAGVAGRKDLCRLRVPAPWFRGPGGDDLMADLATYDLVFGALSGGDRDCDLYLSTLEITDLETFRADLAERFPALEVSHQLGCATLVGFGIGSRPASLMEAWRALNVWGFDPLGSYTGRESLSFVLPVDQVDGAVGRMHRELVLPRLADSGAGQGDTAAGVSPPATEVTP